MITKQLIEEIIRFKPSITDLPDWLADQLCNIDIMRRTLASIDNEKQKAYVIYQEKILALDRQATEARSKCPHYIRSCHRGATGDDNYTTCSICGKELQTPS